MKLFLLPSVQAPLNFLTLEEKDGFVLDETLFGIRIPFPGRSKRHRLRAVFGPYHSTWVIKHWNMSQIE
jgi:hypothetical protein